MFSSLFPVAWMLMQLPSAHAFSYGSYNSGYGYGGYGYSGYSSGFHSNGPIISLELDEKKSRELDLRIAARESRIADLERLLYEGVDANGKSDEGETALIEAARVCALDSARELLKKHADVNLRDARGRTALMYAVMEGCLDVTQLLLRSRRIQLDVRDEEHFSALDYAIQGASLDVDGPTIQILRLIKRAIAKKAKPVNR